MLLTNLQIFEGFPLIKKIKDQKLSIKSDFYISKLVKTLEPLFTLITEKRDAIILSNCKKDEDGKPIPAKDENGNPLEGQIIIENPAKAQYEVTELMTIENEVDVTKIDMEINITLSMTDLMKIEWLFN